MSGIVIRCLHREAVLYETILDVYGCGKDDYYTYN